MKEYKLTPEAAYPTLDRASAFQSNGFSMPEGKDIPPKERSRPRREEGRISPEEAIVKILRSRLESGESFGEVEMRKILERMGIEEHPEDAELRKGIFEDRQKERLDPDYDVYNELGRGGGGGGRRPRDGEVPPEDEGENEDDTSGGAESTIEQWSVRRREAFSRRYEGTAFAREAEEFATLMGDPVSNLERINSLLQELAERMREGQESQGSEFDPEGIGSRLRLEIGNALAGAAERVGGRGRGEAFTAREMELIASPTEEGKIFREQRFNQLFENANANPSQPFNESFDIFTDKPVYRRFMEIMRMGAEQLKNEGNIEGFEELSRETRKYTEEFSVRSTLHDANYILTTNVGPDKISEFASRLTSGQMDLAFRKKGATAAMHFYEQALIKVREENYGYLPYEEVVGDTRKGIIGRVEVLARKYMRDALAAGAVYEVKDGPPDPITGLENKVRVEPNAMEDWEIDRALAIARGLGVMTGRFVEIAMTGKLPRGRYTSLWAHGFLGSLSPFRHSIGKFGIGEEKNRFLMYKLENQSKKWDMQELEEVTDDLVYNVVNGLVPDENMRLLGKVNPLHTGGIVSKTGWRVAGSPTSFNPHDKKYKTVENKDEIIEENPIYNETSNSAIGDLIAASKNPNAVKKLKYDPYEWIGTGILIDKARGGLHAKTPEEVKAAKAQIQKQLERTARILPTRLIFNFKEARSYALQEFKERTGDPTAKALLMKHVKGGDETRFNVALDALIVAQEKAIAEHRGDLSFDGVPGGDGVIRDAQLIASIIKEGYIAGGGGETSLMKKLMGDYVDRDYKIPFISGSEDIPWDEYRFEKVGGNIVMRRWNDIGAAAAAGKGIHELVSNLMNAHSQDDIIKLLHPIHAAVDQYDAHRANEVVLDLAIGIDRFFAKDALARVPLVGGIHSLITGKSSFAQVAAGGRYGMAWDERGHYEFARKLRNHRMLSDGEARKLQEITGGTTKDLAKRYAVFIFQALLIAMLLKSLSGVKDGF